MSPGVAVAWTPEVLTHRLDPDHSLNPVLLDVSMRPAGELGVLEGVELLEPAPDAELERVQRAVVPGGGPCGTGKGRRPGASAGDQRRLDRRADARGQQSGLGGSLLAAGEIAEGRD